MFGRACVCCGACVRRACVRAREGIKEAEQRVYSVANE